MNHSIAYEFKRHEGENIVSTCAVESYFSLLKRGVVGTFHHLSPQYLHLYLAEFDHRHNCQKMTDGERTVHGIEESRRQAADASRSCELREYALPVFRLFGKTGTTS